MLSIRRRHQAGDTIVEVMIALAIMGAVLAGAIATASRALRSAQQAQERAQATKVIENNIEILKAYVEKSGIPAKNIFVSDPFCIDSATQNVVQMPTLTPLPSSVALEAAVLAVPPYNAPCVNAGRYHISVEYGGPPTDTFIIIARWERTGGGNDEVRVTIRLHRGNL